MKRLFSILVLTAIICSCGFEIKQKGESEKIYTTVHIMEVGAIQAEGGIEYIGSGGIKFLDAKKIVYTTHISRCVVVESPFPPQQQQVQQPKVETPKANKVDE